MGADSCRDFLKYIIFNVSSFVPEYDQRERRGETSRVAFEMQRPRIMPRARVRDGLGGMDDDPLPLIVT